MPDFTNSVPSSFRRGARGTIDIVSDILTLCRSGKKKTGVMYQANLSHQMLKFYLWHMVELGLLEESADKIFTTTKKGEEFLSYYQRLAAIISGIGARAPNPDVAATAGINTHCVRTRKETK